MYHDTAQRDYVRTELEYRLGRVQDGIAGRRRRRGLNRRDRAVDHDDAGATEWTTAR